MAKKSAKMSFAVILVILSSVLTLIASSSRSSSNFDYPPPVHELQFLSKSTPAVRRRQLRTESTEMTPLFPGYGTHYVYAYIGTPPQRQSLIVDTGSHITAFPCKGCQQCGEHTDNYFDPSQSSSLSIPHCLSPSGHCTLSQSYSEGSSWKGYRVQDRVYLGGESAGSVNEAQSWALNLSLACQTEETGLFRAQLANGVIGLSGADDACKMVVCGGE